MKTRSWILLMLAVALAVMALTYGVTKRRLAATSAADAKSHRPIPTLITTAQPALRVFTRRVPWIGVVEAQAAVQLTALVNGRVEAIVAVDQAPIRQGGLVARLGGPQLESQRAGLTAEIISLTSQLDHAQQSVERVTLSLKEQLATKDQLAAAQDAQSRLGAQLRETGLALEELDTQARIRAPQDGIFTKRSVSVGQDVQAGQVLGEIIDTSHLRIVASVFSPEGLVLLGRTALIGLDNEQSLRGLVQRVLPISGDAGALQVWIEGPEIDRRLHPGETVGGSIVESRSALAVPESAIVYDAGERPHLFVVAKGAYEARSIRLGLAQDGFVEVLSGLERSQAVVVQGAYELLHRRFNEQFKVQD